MATTNFYVQEYRDITLKQSWEKLRRNYAKSYPYFEPFHVQNDLFWTIFGQNKANYIENGKKPKIST